MSKRQLTEKEAYLAWSIICWFDKPVSDSLKFKLYDLTNPDRHKEMKDKYEKRVLKRIVEIGKMIEEHPRWLK